MIALLLAAECIACHAEAFAKWHGSMHAVASSNALFEAAFRREPMQWCLSCHQPSGAEGVGCADCHLRGGEVLAARAPSAAALSAHPMRVEPALRESEFCGRCHQFNFPIGRNEPVQLSHNPMQDTLAEWRASGEARTCQACHAPHAPWGAHDPALLRRALTASVQRSGGEVRVELVSHGVGHRLPTGDPFRRLRIEVCADAECARVVASRVAGRTLVPRGESWALIDDLTVPPRAPRILEFEAPGEGRFWRVSYLYAAPSTEADLSPEERIVEVARGEIR